MCAVFEENEKKLNAIAHIKMFCPFTTALNAFTDTN